MFSLWEASYCPAYESGGYQGLSPWSTHTHLRLLINLLLCRSAPWELDLSPWGCGTGRAAWWPDSSSVVLWGWCATALTLPWPPPPSCRARGRSPSWGFRTLRSWLDPARLAAVGQGRPTAGSSSPHRPGLGRQAGRCYSNQCRQSGDSPAVFQHKESTLSCITMLEKLYTTILHTNKILLVGKNIPGVS